MFNRKKDLLYMRIFFCTINLIIVYAFINRFWTAIVDFTSNDEQFQKIFHEPGSECRNLTLITDHLLRTSLFFFWLFLNPLSLFIHSCLFIFEIFEICLNILSKNYVFGFFY